MSPERWHVIRSLFDEAVRCEPRDRESLLRDRCAGDNEMRAAVERLLADDELRPQRGIPLVSRLRTGRERRDGKRRVGLSTMPGSPAQGNPTR